MRVIAIIQARMSSTRLSGKVLFPILETPMLLHMVHRVRRSQLIAKVIVVTSDQPSDDAIATVMQDAEVDCFRGDLDNVLSRFCSVAEIFGPVDAIVRLTGDCPLIDWRVIDQVITHFDESKADYVSNVHPPTFPDGLDVEVFSANALKMACDRANTVYEYEHVTPFFYNNSEICSTSNFSNLHDDMSAHRWTVDEAKDFEKVQAVFDGLFEQYPDFSMQDIHAWLNLHPEIDALNQKIVRNAGVESVKDNNQ